MIPPCLIPKGLRWCVAGGYAACPALARDVDVWVYGIKGDVLESRRDEIAGHIRTTGYTFLVSDETRQAPTYEHDTVTILKVGTVEEVTPIHIMVTDAMTPMMILEGFDVSTHAVAIMPDGIVVTHPRWTAPHLPPREIRINEKTPDRMARIAARFGHVLPHVKEMAF